MFWENGFFFYPQIFFLEPPDCFGGDHELDILCTSKEERIEFLLLACSGDLSEFCSFEFSGLYAPLSPDFSPHFEICGGETAPRESLQKMLARSLQKLVRFPKPRPPPPQIYYSGVCSSGLRTVQENPRHVSAGWPGQSLDNVCKRRAHDVNLV